MNKFGIVCFLAFFLASGQLSARGQSDFDWKAFHRANDQEWARRTGLSPEEIRKLRLAAGIADDEPENRLDKIDAKTLRHGGILFVTASGSGHCLHVSVYLHHGRGFNEIWSASELPEGGGFCHPSLCADALVFAGKNDEVVVSVPVLLDGAAMGVCDESIRLTYRGTGKTYVLKAAEHVQAQCTPEYYRRAVQMAFEETDDSSSGAVERLVTIDVFPSFSPESAIAFNKTFNGLTVTQLAFTQQASRQLAIFQRHQTPSQCIAAAKAIPIQRTPVNITSEEAQQWLDALAKIDLLTDTCPRGPDGQCALMFDGIRYTITMRDGRTERLTDVTGPRIRSENPGLLHWIKDLRQLVRLHQDGAQQ